MTAHAIQIPDERQRIRDEVATTYARVAAQPDADYHFHRGPAYAATQLRYDRRELDALPSAATARFAGVGNPVRVGPIRSGDTVVDLGCGAGMDLLLAAQRVRPGGKAIGVDMTPAMRQQARAAIFEAGLPDIAEVRSGYLEALPVEDASVDIVISNGVINLVPDKMAVFKEIVRVLRPGGCLYLADVILQRSIAQEARSNAELWAACIAGAMSVEELYLMAAGAGLQYGNITEWFDAYRGTSAEHEVSQDLRVRGANFFARK